MKLTPAKTLSELCELIGATYFGPADHLISGINEIHKVEPGDLSFVDHPKYYDKCLNSDRKSVV